MRRGTKRERHLAHFKETGQMTPWLAKRLEWDKKMADQLFAEMYNRPTDWMAVFQTHVHQHMQVAIKEQFEKQSLFYKHYVGAE